MKLPPVCLLFYFFVFTHHQIIIFIISSSHIKEWTTHKDWIVLGIRQILVEMHGVPTPEGMPNDEVTKRFFQKDLDLSQFYDDFTNQGYALYNRDEHGAGPELSFVKLDAEFWGP